MRYWILRWDKIVIKIAGSQARTGNYGTRWNELLSLLLGRIWKENKYGRETKTRLCWWENGHGWMIKVYSLVVFIILSAKPRCISYYSVRSDFWKTVLFTILSCFTKSQRLSKIQHSMALCVPYWIIRKLNNWHDWNMISIGCTMGYLNWLLLACLLKD